MFKLVNKSIVDAGWLCLLCDNRDWKNCMLCDGAALDWYK